MKKYLLIFLSVFLLAGCLESPTKPEIPEEPEIFLSNVYGNFLVEDDDLFQIRQTEEGVLLSVNSNLNLEYYSFQGEIIYNDSKFLLSSIQSLFDGVFVSNLDLPDDENGFSRARFAAASNDLETTKDLVLLEGSIAKETMVCFEDLIYDEISYNKIICLQLTK